MSLPLAFAVVLFGAVLISERAERTVLATTMLFLLAGIVLGRGSVGHFSRLSPHQLEIIAEPVLFSVLFADGMGAGVRPPQRHYFGASHHFRPLNALALGLLILAVSWHFNANTFLPALPAALPSPISALRLTLPSSVSASW